MDDVNCLLADAYAFFQQGVYFDEDGQKDDALKMYEKGVDLFEKAERSKNVQKNDLYADLANTKARVLPRISELRSGKSPADSEKAEKIRESLESTRVDDADLIYWLPDGVQLTIIQKDSTYAPSAPSALAILKLDAKAMEAAKSGAPSDSAVAEGPAALIQVGPWAYPLYPHKTAILKNELGVYIVPNPTPEAPDMFVGIILPRDLDPKLEEEFVYVLNQFAVLKTSEVVGEMTAEERERTSERIAAFLIKSGDVFAHTVNSAATRTGSFIADRGERYRAGIPARDGDPVNINPAIRHSVFVLHKGSKVVAKVTRLLLNKIGEVGESVGRSVANSVGGESSGGRLIKGTFTVLGGGITGASTAWMSLEDASKTLFRNFADETVQTVQVKYGDEASETTRHALYAAGHTTLASFQLYELGPRSVAGHMARRAGLQFVRNYTDGPPPPTGGPNATLDSMPHPPPALKASGKPKQN